MQTRRPRQCRQPPEVFHQDIPILLLLSRPKHLCCRFHNVFSHPSFTSVSLFKKTRYLPFAALAPILHASPKPRFSLFGQDIYVFHFLQNLTGSVLVEALSTTMISYSTSLVFFKIEFMQFNVYLALLNTGIIIDTSALSFLGMVSGFIL